jgi:hypothetical protein
MLASADDNLNDSLGCRHETESIIFYQNNHKDTRSCVAMIASRKLPAATTFNIQNSTLLLAYPSFFLSQLISATCFTSFSSCRILTRSSGSDPFLTILSVNFTKFL